MKNIIKTLLVVMVLVLAITGCDLFAPECTHANVEFVLGVEPTCTEDGLTSGFKCKDCGEWVVPQEVDPAGHDYVVDMDGLDPTCTEDGYTDYKKCGRCDAIDGKEVVPNLGGHKMEAVEAKETGCEENPGYNAHNACSVCGYSEDRVYTTYGEDGGHTFAEENTFVYEAPTCTEVGLLAGYCSTCGNAYLLSYIPATGHDYDENGACKVEECGHVYVAYYLIGYINGADVGCEGDYATLPADYMFVDGQLVVTFTADSYVFVKSANYAGENKDWFMSAAYEQGTTATLANTNTGTSEKMFVPGGVELTFSLTVNEDGTLTLSYTTPVVEEGGADVEEGGAED